MELGATHFGTVHLLASHFSLNPVGHLNTSGAQRVADLIGDHRGPAHFTIGGEEIAQLTICERQRDSVYE